MRDLEVDPIASAGEREAQEGGTAPVGPPWRIPVCVAFERGGVCESVVAGRTGLFFGEPTPEALADAVRRAAARPWNAEEIRAQALNFTPQRFIDGLDRCLAAVLEET